MAAIATGVSRVLSYETIYTAKLRRRGIDHRAILHALHDAPHAGHSPQVRGSHH